MMSGTILASDMFFSHPAGWLDPKKAISVTYETYISGTCNRRGEEKSRRPDVERGCRSQAGCKSSREEACCQSRGQARKSNHHRAPRAKTHPPQAGLHLPPPLHL